MLAKPSIMRKVQLPAGTVIFSQGDTSREIYILNKGVVEVLSEGKVVAKISQRGAFFGEMAAILRENRNATLRAQTDCTCVVLYEEYIDAIIRSTPEIGFTLVRLLAGRLKQTTSKLTTMIKEHEDFQFKNAYQVMVAMGLISKENLRKAVILMKQDPEKKNIIHYLKQVEKTIEEKEVATLVEIFSKHN